MYNVRRAIDGEGKCHMPEDKVVAKYYFEDKGVTHEVTVVFNLGRQIHELWLNSVHLDGHDSQDPQIWLNSRDAAMHWLAEYETS